MGIMGRVALALTVALGASPLLAAGPVAPEKARELAAKGIKNWRPAQGRAGGPTHARVPGKAAPLRPAAKAPHAPSDTQTMQFDNGILNALPTVFGQVYGNRFQYGQGGVPLGAITLNSFSFYFMEDSLPDTGLFFQVANPLNTLSITALSSVNVAGLMNSGPSFSAPAINVVDANTPFGTMTMFNDTFFLGGWCLNSAAAFPITNEALGLATGTTMGRGLRGYTAVSGTGPVAFGAQAFNAILRANVTSAATVPVELMGFGVQ